ncbi:hypothetical protein [Mesobacterium pallidum]|uniref:hypothetical protein n=1 Tax=Mesobacterium pallidum TaxID=2872037 RepID=UPI001EE1713F|nr:hypothetical protein [Mesobacterium pallidum]
MSDLGHRVMVTPFSRAVGTMALLNVIGTARDVTVPGTVTRCLRGRVGLPMSDEVEDRNRSSKRAKEPEAEPHIATLDALRGKIGRHLADEAFLPHPVMPADQVDALMAAPKAADRYAPARRRLARARIETPGLALKLNGET